MKVTDFGLAKSVRGDSGSTQLGSIVGTPDYMSPEQCRGQAVDARADVYLLGLTAFYVLTGERPRTGASVGAVLDEQMNHPLRPVSTARRGLPPAVDGVLARLCAKDPTQRTQTMGEAIALLETLRPRAVVIAPLMARITAACLDVVVFFILVGATETAIRLAGLGLASRRDLEWIADFIGMALLTVLMLGACLLYTSDAADDLRV